MRSIPIASIVLVGGCFGQPPAVSDGGASTENVTDDATTTTGTDETSTGGSDIAMGSTETTSPTTTTDDADATTQGEPQTTGVGAGPVILYATAGPFSGNLVGAAGARGSSARDAADDLCAQEPMPGECAVVHAMLSTSRADTIAAMPANLGLPADAAVESATGVPLAESWPALLQAGSLAKSLLDAGVVSERYWTGADAQGGFEAANNCHGWTVGDLTAFGQTGDALSVTATWLADVAWECDDDQFLLCACW